MDKKETGLKLVNTLVWGAISFIFGRFIITPGGQYLEEKASNLNLGFKNPLDADNLAINSIQEGEYKKLPNLVAKQVFATQDNTSVYTNPFTNNQAIVSWTFKKGEPVGKLGGNIARYKGVIMADIEIPNKGKGWVNISSITKV